MVDSGRTARGTFAPGHPKVGGRATSPRNAITNALRRMVDPDEVAGFLIAVMKNPGLAMRDRIAAAKEILDRTEGRAVQTLDVNAQIAQSATLPPGWRELPPAERARFLDAVDANPTALLTGVADER